MEKNQNVILSENDLLKTNLRATECKTLEIDFILTLCDLYFLEQL